MACKEIQEKYKFVIETSEMNEIFKCVGKQYEQEIQKLRKDIETYKRQISNLIKDIS